MLFVSCLVNLAPLPIHTQKEETAHRSLPKAKLLFFSVLLAFGQRNNHFSGCKGTHNKWNMQQFLRLPPKDLSFFMIASSTDDGEEPPDGGYCFFSSG